RRSIRRSATSARAARWTSAPIAPAAPKPTAARPSTRNTAPTGLPKASCRCARRCARPNRCWPAMARSSRKFTRSGWPSAVTVPAPGAGRPPITRRLRPERKARRGQQDSRRYSGGEERGGSDMAKLIAHVRGIMGALALAFVVAWALPVAAQQPSSVNPTASAVKEQQLLDQLKVIRGLGTIPDTRSYTIEQPAGRDWRHFRTVTLRWIGGIAILGMLALLILFYLWRGMVKIESGRSGRKVVRFNAFERFVHWMTATCFIILAISGLNITFGRPLLLPLIGPDAFTAWSDWARLAHHYLSFPFTIGVILIFLMWIGGNIPRKIDVEWLKRGGGIVGHDHPPAYRFN